MSKPNTSAAGQPEPQPDPDEQPPEKIRNYPYMKGPKGGNLLMGQIGTPESRAKGRLARAEAARNRNRSSRQRLADELDQQFDKIARAWRLGLMSDDPMVRIRAAESLWDRVMGKPKEDTQAAGDSAIKQIESMSKEERAALAASATAKLHLIRTEDEKSEEEPDAATDQ